MSILHDIIFFFIKRGQTEYDPNNPPDYAKNRIEEAKGVPQGLPKGVKSELYTLNGNCAEYLYADDNPKNKLILHFHGGGFIAGSRKTVRPMLGAMVKALGRNILTVEYRLAPEHPYPAAFEDCANAYCRTLEKLNPQDITVMGESAGGNLALAAVLYARDQNLPLPASIVAMAPAVQFDCKFPSYLDNKKTDCMVSNLHEQVQDTYLRSRDEAVLHDPYAAPYYGDFTGFPPTLLIASDSEVLRDDSVNLCGKMQGYGVDCQLSLYHRMMHIFEVIPSLPETKKAFRQIREFLDSIDRRETK